MVAISYVLVSASDVCSCMLLLSGAARELIAMYCRKSDFYPFSVALAHCLFVLCEVVVAAVHSLFYLTTMAFFYI